MEDEDNHTRMVKLMCAKVVIREVKYDVTVLASASASARKTYCLTISTMCNVGSGIDDKHREKSCEPSRFCAKP